MLRPGGETNWIPTYFLPGPPHANLASVNSPSATCVTRMYPIGIFSSSAWKCRRIKIDDNYDHHNVWCPLGRTKLLQILTSFGYLNVRFRMAVLLSVCCTYRTRSLCNKELWRVPHSWTRVWASTHVHNNWTNKIARRKFIFHGQIVRGIPTYFVVKQFQMNEFAKYPTLYKQ